MLLLFVIRIQSIAFVIEWFMQIETGKTLENGIPAWLFLLIGIIVGWIVKVIVDKYLNGNSDKPED